jgi:polar amino acid transport system permease protein
MLDIIQQYWLYLLIGEYPHGPLGGLAMTLIIAAVSLILTFPNAVLVALARTSNIGWLARPALCFVYIIRSLPLLMLLFWIYYFLPVVLGYPINAFWSIIIAIVVFQTAYLSEVIRAAIEALPKGQTEAARALGLRYPATMWKVILPQALYNALPGILNQLTAMIKETSLGYILALNELTYSAGQINSLLMTKPFQVFGILAIVYFALCFSLTRATHHLDVRIQRRRLVVQAV